MMESGKRPAPLAESSGPQEAAVTVGYVAAAGPMGCPPRLQGEDGIDDRTTRFLLRANLALKKEEEKVRRREREEAEYEAGMQELNQRVRADIPLSSAEDAAWRRWIGLFHAKKRGEEDERGRRGRRNFLVPGFFLVQSRLGVCIA